MGATHSLGSTLFALGPILSDKQQAENDTADTHGYGQIAGDLHRSSGTICAAIINALDSQDRDVRIQQHGGLCAYDRIEEVPRIYHLRHSHRG